MSKKPTLSAQRDTDRERERQTEEKREREKKNLKHLKIYLFNLFARKSNIKMTQIDREQAINKKISVLEHFLNILTQSLCQIKKIVRLPYTLDTSHLYY